MFITQWKLSRKVNGALKKKKNSNIIQGKKKEKHIMVLIQNVIEPGGDFTIFTSSFSHDDHTIHIKFDDTFSIWHKNFLGFKGKTEVYVGQWGTIFTMLLSVYALKIKIR